MPAFQPAILTDGTNAITLNPAGATSGKYDYSEAGAATEMEAVKMRLIQSQNRSTKKHYVRLVEPFTAINSDTGLVMIQGQPMIATMELSIPVGISNADRERFVRQAFSMNLEAALKSVLETGENVWGA